MKTLLSILWISVMAVFFSAASGQERTRVLITTPYGDMTVELYNETPLHRDNFLRLAKEGFYDGLLFHRVINHFMIQGGDPDSRGAARGQRLGGGGPGYQIPAEIHPELYHKKGALAAARQGDQTNPEKKSSGSQFYIIHGTVYRPGQIDTMEMKTNTALLQTITRSYFNQAQDELQKFRDANDEQGFMKRVEALRTLADSTLRASGKWTIPENRRKEYTTLGGYPSLDGSYTVFGQVVEGLEVIEKIAAVKTDRYDRPVEDVVMKIKVIE